MAPDDRRSALKENSKAQTQSRQSSGHSEDNVDKLKTSTIGGRKLLSKWRWKPSREKFREIFSLPYEKLRGTTFDLTPYATEERFRFIDCDAWVHDQVLKIYESSTLPADSHDLYSAVSYVWFGLTADTATLEHDGWFRVYCGTRTDGTIREDGGPISLRVLSYACHYSSANWMPLLWLDRLCIKQTSRRDKTWQIRGMYELYASCDVCIVLPGGLQRLASVYDETSWAQRAWTYQEAIACWEHAVILTCDWYHFHEEWHWLVPEECHWGFLLDLFVEGDRLLDIAQMAAYADAMGAVGDPNEAPRPVLVLGRDSTELNTLARICEYLTMNGLPDDGGERIPEHDIRQLFLLGVQMRTSSRPVDMVFSIIGLVDVEEEMEIERFRANDRFKATLALVECILRIEDSDDDSKESRRARNDSMFDVPLWVNIAGLDIDSLPTLHDLALILDTPPETAHSPVGAVSAGSSLKYSPVEDWSYDVNLAKDNLAELASTVAENIPDSVLLDAYHMRAESERMILMHQTEGPIELLRTLDISKQTDVSKSTAAVEDLLIFGWTVKTEAQTTLRFYRFDVSHLVS